MKIQHKHIFPYILHRPLVQYTGIINGAELKEYRKTEPKYSGNAEIFNNDYYEAIRQWNEKYPQEKYGTKYGYIKDVRILKNYIAFYVGMHPGHLKRVFTEDIRLCLRPMSDLVKEITHNKKKFTPLTELLRGCNFDVDRMLPKEQLEYLETFKIYDLLSLKEAEKLFEWHFDVFNLIDQGLAVDINTINLK